MQNIALLNFCLNLSLNQGRIFFWRLVRNMKLIMLIVSIFDDELLDGYVGRLMTFHSKMSEFHLRNHLLEHVNDQESSDKSLLSLLSGMGCLNRKNAMEVLSDHTLLPVYDAMHDLEYVSDYITMEILKTLDRKRRDSARQVLRVCPDCVAEDLQEHGASFWHRSHQLPGRLFCPMHLKPLSWLADRRLIHFQPEHVLKQAIPLTVEEMGTSPYLMKQIEAVFDAVLHQRIRFTQGGFESILYRGLEREWPGLTKHEKVERLKKRLEGMYGVPWLKFLLPQRTVASKSGVTSFSKLSLLNQTTLSTELAVVALFAVVASAQEVFNEFTNPKARSNQDMDLTAVAA